MLIGAQVSLACMSWPHSKLWTGAGSLQGLGSLGDPEAARLKAARLLKLPAGELAAEKPPRWGINRC